MTLLNTSINLSGVMRKYFPKTFWKYSLKTIIICGFIFISAAIIIFVGLRIFSERKKYLFYTRNWASVSLIRAIGKDNYERNEKKFSVSIGGGSVSLLPLDIKRYLVKPGDTLSEIAHRFGMDLDTVASLNREWGSGVHLITIGEEIKIPNQDGIYIRLEKSLEETCARNSIPPEVVLQVNRVESAAPDMELFFPGVQHTGIERSVVIGTAFLWPVRGYITSGYGYRRDPFTGKIKFHRGTDIGAPVGTIIRSTLDGLVLSVGHDPMFGKYILIKHQIGYTSLYGHLDSTLVKKSDWVRRGQRIGLVGSTGTSTGPHLHFELRKNGVPINTAGLITGIY